MAGALTGRDIMAFLEIAMPIYEYKCSACGFQKEYIQKMSDAPHTVCPECGQVTFSKMLSVAGFQLKGSGWYQTDFKDGPKPNKPKDVPKPKDGSSAPTCGGGGCGCAS